MIVEIVILAMIAAFLGLRLYAVLGRRPEQNEEPMPDPASAPRSMAPRLPEKTTGAPRTLPLPQDNQLDSRAEAGIRAVVAADRRFDVGQFLGGARGAYGMVLEAFWRGDKDELLQLCDSDVYAGFAEAIDARTAAGETVTAKLIRIEEARIVDASYASPRARITVSFVADVASVTRDASGAVVAGSLDDAIETRDVWTFSRDLTARDPDWVVDETDEG